MNRNRAIDYAKGLTVALMVLCHVMQFFGKAEIPSVDFTMSLANILAFPLFVFTYGQSVYLAYCRRPFRAAAPRLLMSSLRAYAAFCLSGIAYLVLCQADDLSSRTVLRVATLQSIPGWSEFLIAFALFGLAALLLLPLLPRLLERRAAVLAVAAACLLGVLVPYAAVDSSIAGLLIGTTRYSAFPILQYMPFFLMGLYAGRYGFERKALWVVLSAAMSGAAAVYTVRNGLPSRFPPSLMWLLLPCALIVLLSLLAAWVDHRAEGCRPLRRILSPLESLGRNSLYYLLSSNLVIFALSRTKTLPIIRKSERFPFTVAQGTFGWAIIWTLVLLLAIGFMASLTRKPPREPRVKVEK